MDESGILLTKVTDTPSGGDSNHLRFGRHNFLPSIALRGALGGVEGGGGGGW